MAKDVINVDGQDVIVREDTAKAYRGVHWGVTVVVVCLAIMAIVTIGFFISTSLNGKIESPAQIENRNGQ